MSWKIVLDSSADYNGEFEPANDVTVEEVPLTIHVGEREFIDNNDLDTNECTTC